MTCIRSIKDLAVYIQKLDIIIPIVDVLVFASMLQNSVNANVHEYELDE